MNSNAEFNSAYFDQGRASEVELYVCFEPIYFSIFQIFSGILNISIQIVQHFRFAYDIALGMLKFELSDPHSVGFACSKY